MLAELVGEDGGVEPVERELAAVDHVDQRVQHLALLPHFVAEAEVLAALDQADRLGRRDRTGAARAARCTRGCHVPILPEPTRHRWRRAAVARCVRTTFASALDSASVLSAGPA